MISCSSRTDPLRDDLPSASREPMTDHFFRVDDLVKALFLDEARAERSLLQSQILVIGLVCNGRRLVVTDNRAQRRHQHERPAEHLVDTLAVEPRSFHREAPEL